MTQEEEREKIETIRNLTREKALEFYEEVRKEDNMAVVRWLGRNDRFFLLGVLMQREDVLKKDWCYERCRELEREPDGWLDLWSRFHYKSTLITLAGSVQEILRDPEITIGILSYTKPFAQHFVDQIRRALEADELKRTYPDILYDKPPRVNWSTQGGLIVKRRGNPKEPTVSGSGLVDGQPIGMHYRLRIYDDVVTPASVTTPEQIMKTTEAWELSLALGTEDGGRQWYAGTRYHPDDTYSVILSRGTLRERRRLCVDADGKPTMMKAKDLDDLRHNMGAQTWAAQMLQNPIAAGVRVFKDEWLLYYSEEVPLDTSKMAKCIIIDSANAKKKNSDFTVMLVMGRTGDGTWYLLDGVYDRLNLAERTRALFSLARAWWPFKMVWWEQQGAMSDVEHVRGEMNRELFHFPITALHHNAPKDDRIRRLVPVFEQGRIVIPGRMMRMRVDGQAVNLTQAFLDQYQKYPIVKHDDFIDCLASIKDPEIEQVMQPPKALGGLGGGGQAAAQTARGAFQSGARTKWQY